MIQIPFTIFHSQESYHFSFLCETAYIHRKCLQDTLCVIVKQWLSQCEARLPVGTGLSAKVTEKNWIYCNYQSVRNRTLFLETQLLQLEDSSTKLKAFLFCTVWSLTSQTVTVRPSDLATLSQAFRVTFVCRPRLKQLEFLATTYKFASRHLSYVIP
jgi:hypothetical protein